MYWRDCRSKHTVNEYLGVTVCYLLMKRTFNLHSAVSVYRIFHNRDKFSTRVLSIYIPTMREKITGSFFFKYNGHQTIIFFGAAPSLQFRKNEDINYTQKKFVSFLRNQTLMEFQCSLNLSREKEAMVMKFKTPNYMKYNC